MFKSTATGFHMTFANGWTVSVQYDRGNYASRTPDGATLAETAVFDPSGEFVKIGETDDVRGWQTSDQVAALIAETAARF